MHPPPPPHYNKYNEQRSELISGLKDEKLNITIENVLGIYTTF